MHKIELEIADNSFFWKCLKHMISPMKMKGLFQIVSGLLLKKKFNFLNNWRNFAGESYLDGGENTKLALVKTAFSSLYIENHNCLCTTQLGN